VLIKDLCVEKYCEMKTYEIKKEVMMNVRQYAKMLFTGNFKKMMLAVMLVAVILGASIAAMPSKSASAHAANSGNSSVQGMISAVFGADAPAAMRIAACESGFNPNAVNPQPVDGSHAQGVFQILYPLTWKGTSQAAQSPFNAHANIVAAHEIFVRDGHSWREWQCKP
jgi:Transglycosylase SLT domain